MPAIRFKGLIRIGLLAAVIILAPFFVMKFLSGLEEVGTGKETLVLVNNDGKTLEPEIPIEENASENVPAAEPIIEEKPVTVNLPPAADSLATKNDYCGGGLATIFSWVYSDPENDPQSFRQIQVDDSADFSSPADDTGKFKAVTNSYVTIASKLNYNTLYFWRLKVWDASGNDSGWVNGRNFRTPRHGYPKIDFKWMPTPRVKEEVVFTDRTRVFGGAKVSTWSWVIQGATPKTSSDKEVIVIYGSLGDYEATLTVTDSSGYSCSLQKSINVKNSLRDWEES
jgi:hypothetical protein